MYILIQMCVYMYVYIDTYIKILFSYKKKKESPAIYDNMDGLLGH